MGRATKRARRGRGAGRRPGPGRRTTMRGRAVGHWSRTRGSTDSKTDDARVGRATMSKASWRKNGAFVRKTGILRNPTFGLHSKCFRKIQVLRTFAVSPGRASFVFCSRRGPATREPSGPPSHVVGWSRESFFSVFSPWLFFGKRKKSSSGPRATGEGGPRRNAPGFLQLA